MAEESDNTENTISSSSLDTDDLNFRKQEMEEDLNDPVALVERVYQIWWHWADFHLFIISPSIQIINPPLIIKPEPIQGTDELEFVYSIYDSGSKLSTSKGSDMVSSGMSMCKLYMTIEKMVYLLIERLKSGGIDTQTEVQVAFGGHLLPQRKAFESIINLAYNVVVTNFDPASWGDWYLQTVKRNVERFGYPPESPREMFKTTHHSSGMKVK